MTDKIPEPRLALIPYQTADGRAHVEGHFDGETLWLTQGLMAELLQKDV